jgi:hypothetical protein
MFDMSTLQQISFFALQSIAANKESLIQEALDQYYGFRVPLSFLMGGLDLNCIVRNGVETYYIDENPVLEIHPIELDTEDLSNVSLTFKYRSLI